MTNYLAAVAAPTQAPNENEAMLLELLRELIGNAISSLKQGEAEGLLELSWQIRSTADNLTILLPELLKLPQTAEAQENRRQLMNQLTQQRSLCRALLRRRRRFLLLRRQLQDLCGEQALYTESLASKAY